MKKTLIVFFIILSILTLSEDFRFYREYELNNSTDKNIKVEMLVSNIIFDYSAKNEIQIRYKNTLNEFPNINMNKYVNNTNISEDFIDSYKTFSLFKRLALGKDTFVKNWNGEGEYKFLIGYPLEEAILINNKGYIDLKNINIRKNLRVINFIGNSYLKNITSKNLQIENKMGKIDITNIFVENKTSIVNETGNISISNHGNLINDLEINSEYSLISLQGIDARKIEVSNKKGRIDMIIKNVENLNIDMEKGNIFLKLYGDDFNLDIETKNGDIRVFGEEKDDKYKSSNQNNTNNIKVRLDTGNIYIDDISYIN
ncbi:DUF4097 family beta strand repeat-containing protein [Geotoga petraea]|uniref:Putative adhesin n=1 Tax=Geotoga petraea TaxID=28234 RepID=A0A1G6PZR6_9BACT|nr:DUF4097 family beta strand repeat-containing protein [Geotoga petraea]SDC85036.1 Putative adhesin [Geotoga petraea]